MSAFSARSSASIANGVASHAASCGLKAAVSASATIPMVVGAGSTGLTMAAELARRGVRVRLIDRQEGPSSDSRALAIQPRTLELFDLMGIVAPVLAEGLPIQAASIPAAE